VAGTAHFGFYGLSIGRTDIGDGQGAVQVLDSMQHPTNQPNPNFTCDAPINTGPAHFVLDAAFHRLDRWVSAGVLPPVAPRLQTTGVSPVVFARDAHGNVLGGIRTPAVDAPVATLSGSPTGGSQFCFLFGTTTPFTPEQLAALYPDHDSFVSAWTDATEASHAAGFLVAADTRELIAAGAASTIPAA
jgi:Alpha/beta hydrolase domain